MAHWQEDQQDPRGPEATRLELGTKRVQPLDMRFVVVGAGAVGGVVGGRLFEHGSKVLLVARGEHSRIIAKDGLTIASPAGVVKVNPPVTDRIDGVDWTEQDVILLAVKSQDSEEALCELSAVAPSSTPVVCMQNGVANETVVLRRFSLVYAMCVMCPSSYLSPGVVVARSSPITALLDLGRYPGVDEPDQVAVAISEVINRSSMQSVPRPDIMRWKYAKLLLNLGNAVDALCGPGARNSHLTERAHEEGEACLVAAGIPYASREEDAARRDNLLTLGAVPGYEELGSSTWQSLARSSPSTEVDYLNGEIVLLGRLHGVPTPVNELLRSLVNKMARERSKPRIMTADEVLSMLPT